MPEGSDGVDLSRDPTPRKKSFSEKSRDLFSKRVAEIETLLTNLARKRHVETVVPVADFEEENVQEGQVGAHAGRGEKVEAHTGHEEKVEAQEEKTEHREKFVHEEDDYGDEDFEEYVEDKLAACTEDKLAACTGDLEVTKSLVGALVRKPELNDKLLSRPPFRFLHDVFSAITHKTGFAEGLYDEGMLDAKSIRDKASKMAYLQKMIDCVSFHLGVAVEASTAKIVAGMEIEQTNRLLQFVAVAAASGNSANAVQRVNDLLKETKEPKEMKEPKETEKEKKEEHNTAGRARDGETNLTADSGGVDARHGAGSKSGRFASAPMPDVNVKVAVRCRPFNSREAEKGAAVCVEVKGPGRMDILLPLKSRSFRIPGVLDSLDPSAVEGISSSVKRIKPARIVVAVPLSAPCSGKTFAFNLLRDHLPTISWARVKLIDEGRVSDADTEGFDVIVLIKSSDEYNRRMLDE
jgi:hypothetical protein